jgi:hypothetical protein
MSATAILGRNRAAVAAVTAVVALATIAAAAAVLLTRHGPEQVSQAELIRSTIQKYDNAVQTGDLPTLRSITCGATHDGYASFDEQEWRQTYQRTAAAKQYPVIASIDQVAVNGQHAEANITTFMAYDPAVRSTRSLDLQYRDGQWEICQTSGP